MGRILFFFLFAALRLTHIKNIILTAYDISRFIRDNCCQEINIL